MTIRWQFFSALSLLALPVAAYSAASNTIVGAGYTYPVPINAAPGQIITLFVAGVGSTLTGPVTAGAGTLPTSLAGISVTFQQGVTIAVPMLAVRPVSTCTSASITGCGSLTAITIQIPYQAVPPCMPLSNSGVCPLVVLPPAQLSVTENGTTGAVMELSLLQDQIHVLTTCDTVIGGSGYAPFTGLRCQPYVTHADGSLVTATNPAQSKEELVAYAVGLGQTQPPSITGQPPSVHVPVNESIEVGFDYRPDALPSRTPIPEFFLVAPLFAGLTPGYAGLYKINFIVQPPTQNVFPCINAISPSGADIIESNLTVNFAGLDSFDGARICVAGVLVANN